MRIVTLADPALDALERALAAEDNAVAAQAARGLGRRGSRGVGGAAGTKRDHPHPTGGPPSSPAAAGARRPAGSWHGHVYRRVGLDGFDYWFLWPVINRKPSDRAGWDG
jgi:hypothetical protein